jgi:hypothetical protein
MLTDVDFENKLAKIEKKVSLLKIASSLNGIEKVPKNFEPFLNSLHEELISMIRNLDVEPQESSSPFVDTRVFYKITTAAEFNHKNRLECVIQNFNSQLRNCLINFYEVKIYRVFQTDDGYLFLMSFYSENLSTIKRILKQFSDVVMEEMSRNDFEVLVKTHFSPFAQI